MKTIQDEPVLYAILAIVVAVAALWAVSCGGGGSYSSPTPAAPSTTTPSGVTVAIVSTSGSGAFSPNPVQAASGTTITWKNNTGSTHVLVMNDGTPIGTVGPNATLTTQLNGSGGNFHCSTHPTMVGSVNGASAPPPPTQDPSGGYTYTYAY